MERREASDKRRKIREKHQDWRATEAIVFRGNLQNVSFYRGPYESNWFVIPFYRRPSGIGERGVVRWNVNATRYFA